MADRPEAAPWVWSQHWNDVLFLHWPVSATTLRSQIPASLEIDTYEGVAWVSLVLFRLRVRRRWLPFLPGLSNLIEANVRTYVRYCDQPGIRFLSVYADNAWAIRLARKLTPMPYLRAEMGYRCCGEESEFTVRRPPSLRFALSLAFRTRPGHKAATAGTLDAWLLERYRLYIADRGQRLLQADVVHAPWEIQHADVAISANSIGEQVGLELRGGPAKVHFSRGVQAKFGVFQTMNGWHALSLRRAWVPRTPFEDSGHATRRRSGVDVIFPHADAAEESVGVVAEPDAGGEMP
jgi:uncharacterized protein YqjF (DUF2071 family)